MLSKILVIGYLLLITQAIASTNEVEFIEKIRYPGDTEEDIQEIKNAKVSKQDEAKNIARTAYEKKTEKLGFAVPPKIEVLAFDIPGFGKKGDKIWEIRFTEVNFKNYGSFNATIAILWVHSETAEVYYVIGHWFFEEKKQ